jgi:hypothetical protein
MIAPLVARAFRVSALLGSLVLATLVRDGAQAPTARGAETPAPPAIDFSRQILPILSETCFACHGPDATQRKAKLRLDTKEGALAELRSGGHAIVPGKASESSLIERITSEDPSERMPPPKSRKQLTPQQVAWLRQWIDQGAPWSIHWAWVPPRRPPLPRVADTAWARSPIDAFILARLEAEHWHPSPEASRTTLLRRVTLDLTGLPPTPAEVDAFLADQSPEAYARVVDRLLESPRYGEHMARFWLDASRYGDTHGLHLDNYREMWPYRDWVIRVFNANLPYDRFLVEQLAGDLLPGPTLDQLVASGFNRCHVTTNEGGSIEEEYYVRNVVDRVDTTGTVLLGLTIGCARCHDHKYDPIAMKDYYQLFAFFNSLDDKSMDGNARAYPPTAQLPTTEQATTLERVQERLRAVQGTLAAARVRACPSPSTSSAASHNAPGWRHPPAREEACAWTRATVVPLLRRLSEVEKERTRLDLQIPTTLVSKERPEPRPAYILKRGEYDQKGQLVGRDTPAFLPPLPTQAPRNRLGFAQWLVDPQHPLTARVAINRLWQQCFGTGLVRTAEDFGTQGEPPSHPELLDWLAVQFVEDGWDIKKMMKRIVLSASYRQQSRLTPDRLARDPGNRLLARGPRFRLDAEMLRDQALAVSGLLVERTGGPSVKPPQPSGLWEAVGYTGSNTVKFVADTGCAKVHRRSLYTFWKRTAPPPQMNAFDAPSREACTVRRERTNTPLQALLLLNETQYVEAARALAERTLREGGVRPETRLTYLFRLVTARCPDKRELAELRTTYDDLLATYTQDRTAAQQLIAVGESKPDVTCDPRELATWTMLANLVLNLDEVLTKG